MKLLTGQIHLKSLYKSGKMYESKSKRVLRCSNCGHLEYKTQAWETCPLCSLGQGYIVLDYNKVIGIFVHHYSVDFTEE